MAKFDRLAGSTSQSVNVFVQDSSSTIGTGLSGLAYNTSGLACYYTFTGANTTSVVVSLATLALVTTAFAEGGFIEIDATHQKGLYRLDLKNTSLAASKGNLVTYYLYGAANMAPCVFDVQLTGWDNQDAVHGGLSALPNTAVTTNASLLTSGTSTDQLSVASGRIDAGKILGTAISTPATAGILDINVKNMNNVAATSITTIKAVQGLTTADTIATYTGNTPQTGDAYLRLGAPAGASVSADIAEIESETDLIVTATNTGVAPGAAGGLFIAGTNAATSITTGLTAHLIGTVDTLTTYTGNTPQTGDAYLRLGAPAGASIAADLAEIEGETDTLLAGVTVTTNNDKTGYAITSNIKKNQALTKFQFLMTDSTGHAPSTGLTVTCTRSIDGGAFGAGTLANVTAVSNGTYTVDFGAGDLNGNVIVLRCTAAASDDTFERIVTQP